MVDLVKSFEDALPLYIEKNGFPWSTLFALSHDNEVVLARLAVPQDEVFNIVQENFISDLRYKEIIFGLDRYTRPGQGTKYDDVLTVFWWQGERTEDYGFKFGVINYKPPPNKVIEPIDWDNQFWIGMMRKNIETMFNRMEQTIAKMRTKIGEEKFEEIRNTVHTMAKQMRGES